MKPQFKTVYVEVEYMNHGLSLNGDQLSREMEAALNEQHEQGYRLQEIMPVSAPSGSAPHACGYIMFFKLTETVK